jgi:hypothetical protein
MGGEVDVPDSNGVLHRETKDGFCWVSHVHLAFSFFEICLPADNVSGALGYDSKSTYLFHHIRQTRRMIHMETTPLIISLLPLLVLTQSTH